MDSYYTGISDILFKIVISIIIWFAGSYFINLLSTAVNKLDIPNLNIDNKVVSILTRLINVVGKALLVLLILDYLNIGSNVVGAITNGLSISLAIAFGIAFGQAFTEDAKNLVKSVKEHLNNK